MNRLLDHPAARRLAALAIVAAMGWVVAPIFVDPVARFLDQREQLSAERAILARLGRLDERKAAVARLAAGPNASVFAGDDATALASLLNARTLAAVPVGAMEVTSLEAGPASATPDAAMQVRLSLRATMGGFDAFLQDIETKPPFLTVETMKLSRAEAAAAEDPVILSGSITLSAVSLIRSAP